MRHNPANPHWAGRDRFVLSAGHASMLQYARCTSPATTCRSTTCGSSGSGDRARRATRSTATRRASRPRPARSARASRTPSAWRSPSASSRRATTGRPRDRRPPRLRDLLGRRPDGGRLARGGVARRPPRARQARLRLRRQPHHDRRHDRAHLHRRTRAQRFEAYGWHVQHVDDGNDLRRDRPARSRGGRGRSARR